MAKKPGTGQMNYGQETRFLKETGFLNVLQQPRFLFKKPGFLSPAF
jgi:hypothetical protein